MSTCSYCGARITPTQEKTTIALFSKPVCSKNECTRKAQDEANMQTETLMTPRAKVLALLARRGFVEQSVPGFFVLDGDTQIAIDLNHQVAFPGIPVIGVLQTNGDIIEEGHGINRINDIRQEIEGILKSKSKRQVERERSVGQERSKAANELNSHAILQNSVTPPDESQSSSTEHAQKQPAGAGIANYTTEKTKLGTPDTLTKEVKDDNRQSTERQNDILQNSEHQLDRATPGNSHKRSERNQEHKKGGTDYDIVKGGQESPQPKGKVTIKTCSVCGMELSGARSLECFQKDKPFTCEDCEDKQGETMTESYNLPAKKKQELIVGTCEAVATQYGIPVELANLFFMKMNEGLYIKNPGLLYLAGKKGYSRIEISTEYDEKAQEWSAECKIYPKLTKDVLEGISKLDKDLQKIAFDFATQPTNGTGRASTKSVKMTTMHPFLKEMAQTRAQNRCLRAFTSYGGTSAEELPEAQLERD